MSSACWRVLLNNAGEKEMLAAPARANGVWEGAKAAVEHSRICMYLYGEGMPPRTDLTKSFEQIALLPRLARRAAALRCVLGRRCRYTRALLLLNTD